jgi:hypothetical protein
MLVTDGEIDQFLPITDLPIICWRNVVTASRLSTDSQNADFPVTNLANPSLGLKWKQDYTDSPAVPPEYIILTITSSLGPINYIAIAGHNLATIGATIALEGSSGAGVGSPAHEDSPPDAEYVTGFVPEDDGPIIFMFAEVQFDGFLRLRIENPDLTTPAEIAVMYAGSATVLTEGIQADHTPLPLAKTNDVVLGQSENGSFLGRIVLGDWAESSATIENLTKEIIRSEWLPFLEFASELPFFWVWSPMTYPDETAFAFLDNDPKPVFDIDGFGRLTLDMKGVIE